MHGGGQGGRLVAEYREGGGEVPAPPHVACITTAQEGSGGQKTHIERAEGGGQRGANNTRMQTMMLDTKPWRASEREQMASGQGRKATCPQARAHALSVVAENVPNRVRERYPTEPAARQSVTWLLSVVPLASHAALPPFASALLKTGRNLRAIYIHDSGINLKEELCDSFVTL